MGSQIAKLLAEESDDEEAGLNEHDVEIGEDASSDSSTSSDSDESEYTTTSEVKNEYILSHDDFIKQNAIDPYIVERRFVAGSNSYTYDIYKK